MFQSGVLSEWALRIWGKTLCQMRSLAGPSHSYQHDQQQVKLHMTRAVYGKALLQPKIQGE